MGCLKPRLRAQGRVRQRGHALRGVGALPLQLLARLGQLCLRPSGSRLVAAVNA